MRNGTETMDNTALLIIFTPISFSLLISVLLNILLGGILAKVVLRDRAERHITSKTTSTDLDCEVFVRQPSIAEYSTVRYSKQDVYRQPLDTSHSLPNGMKDIVNLEPNPVYQSADPLPSSNTYVEVN
ncbi:hypothetical protein LOD99_1132 [Oopsacas minuta]|uniref:Uncharacterized protein n=1 Tax=Oopsacas minuta TaxID=111878 RepID=A0AAV7K4X8_9METZ|nr:hypothetical protein LOD99_1132 [Oopsacas minuta]